MATFFMVLRYLVPIAKVLIGIFFPEMRSQLEDLWDTVETFVEKESEHYKGTFCSGKMERNVSTEKKIELFNSNATKMFTAEGVAIEAWQLNLVREIIHTRMTGKIAKAAKKAAKKEAKKSNVS